MKDTIICDIDGTLADLSHRLHHVQTPGKKKDWDAFFAAAPKDGVHEPVWETLRALHSIDGGGYNIIFCSGRPERTRRETSIWISSTCWYKGFELLMRKDGDRRDDSIVKQEILDAHIDKERVLFVLDDRQRVVDMWRRNGLVCFQVAPGDF